MTLLDTLDERGKGARDAAAGRHVCLDGLGHPPRRRASRESLASWNEAHAHYLEGFGPEAATIGPPEGFA